MNASLEKAIATTNADASFEFRGFGMIVYIVFVYFLCVQYCERIELVQIPDFLDDHVEKIPSGGTRTHLLSIGEVAGWACLILRGKSQDERSQVVVQLRPAVPREDVPQLGQEYHFS
jgi:hypothetical protein